MALYILTAEIGISTGHKLLVGIYGTKERVKEAIEKHMAKHDFYDERCYHVNPIELNEEVNVTIAEW